MQKFRSRPTRSQSLDKILASCSLYGFPRSAKRVLEIGYGFADALKHNARIFPNVDFVGLEQDPEFLELQNLPDNLKLEREAIGEFDVILAFGVYSWESESILPLVTKLLKDGGLFVCSFLVKPGFFVRETIRKWISLNSELSAREALRVLKESAPYEFEHPYGLLLHKELSRIDYESDAYIDAELKSEKINPKFLQDICREFSDFGLQYLGDVRPSRTRVRVGLKRSYTDSMLDFSHGISFREGMFIKTNKEIVGKAPITDGIILSASLESIATEEEIEEEFFKLEWPEEFEYKELKLDRINELIFKEKVEASVLRFNPPKTLPEKPICLPKLERCYANFRYDPVDLGPFEEEIAGRCDGSRTLLDIAKELQILMADESPSLEELVESVTDGAQTLLRAGLIRR